MKVLVIIVCMLVTIDISFAACWGENMNEGVAKENEVNTSGKKLKPGDPSPDFMAVDTSGRKFSLKNLKGKYVYIDLWATWCSPCKAEIPHLQRLERLFKRKKIVFVSISCDDDREAWLNYLRRNDMGGIQLNFDGNPRFRSAYGVNAIPRFILLDKKGQVINPNMTRPSDPETDVTLRALKGI